MKAKFSLLAYVSGKRITLNLAHKNLTPPEGATKFYLRYTDENGKRYWLPRCMGGAVYGKRGCHCDPDENERNHLNEYR